MDIDAFYQREPLHGTGPSKGGDPGRGTGPGDGSVFAGRPSLPKIPVAGPPPRSGAAEGGITDRLNSPTRPRNTLLEQAERDAFLLLLHLYNLSGGKTSATFPLHRMSRDLAFGECRADQLAELLAWGRLLYDGSSIVSITEAGVHYLRCAGRRRSARLDDVALPPAALHLLTTDG